MVWGREILPALCTQIKSERCFMPVSSVFSPGTVYLHQLFPVSQQSPLLLQLTVNVSSLKNSPGISMLGSEVPTTLCVGLVVTWIVISSFFTPLCKYSTALGRGRIETKMQGLLGQNLLLLNTVQMMSVLGQTGPLQIQIKFS